MYQSAASITLEYAYDDWTIYHLAKAMGNKEVADRYKERAMNYKKMFNPATGYVSPRYTDGSWKKDFNLYDTHGQGFIEGNSLNYSFFVPHDVKGLISCMGGDKEFVKRLDRLFTEDLPAEAYEHTEDVTAEGILGSYVHGNEPSHHVPYLYMWTSQPWKTAERIREVFDKMYKNRIDGLCGNDDCGQMSAWYVFSAMGFYPVNPVGGEYEIGTPLYPEVRMRLSNGKTFMVLAHGVSGKNRYIRSVKLDGKPYDKSYITHEQIMNGSILEFEMGSEPGKAWY